MEQQEAPIEERNVFRSLIWTPIIALIITILGAMIYFAISSTITPAPLPNFDQMVVTNGFHNISVPSGQRFELAYEQNHDRYFEGTVRHTSMNHEENFPIVSFDILVTSGDYADSSKVWTAVQDHHFSWQVLNGVEALGTINLLHTVPINQAIELQLMQIKEGDHVIIKGWDILNINSYSKSGDYVGTWQDEGCNTTLITEVQINPK